MKRRRAPDEEFFAGFMPVTPRQPNLTDARRLDWLLQPENRWFMHNIAQTTCTPDYARRLIDKEME